MLAVIVLAGCGSSGDADPAPAAACEARATDLAAWATTVDHRYGGSFMARDNLIEDRDAAPLAAGFRVAVGVEVTRDAISVNSRPSADAKAITERIEDARGAGPAGAVVFFIDRDAPTSLLAVAAAGAVAANARDVQLAVARPVTPLPPPPRSSVTDELAATAGGSSTDRAVGVARVLRRVIAGCPGMIRAFGAVGESSHAASKAQAIIDALRPALVECSCNVDLDALRSTMWAIMGPGVYPPAGLVAVTLASSDDRSAAIATGATWADAAPAVFAAATAGERVRIVAPPAR